MFVNFSRNLIFVKTTKTAGSSTEALLQNALWGEPLSHSQGWRIYRDGFCTPRVGWAGRGKRDPLLKLSLMAVRNGLTFRTGGRLAKLRNHSPVEKIAQAVGSGFFDRALKVVNIRNPFDLVVSSYFFQLGQTQKPFSFETYVLERYRRPPVSASLVGHLDGNFRLLRHESLDEDISSLLSELGIVPDASLPTFKSDHRPASSRNYRDLYAKDTRTRVEDLFGDWLEAFDYQY